MSVVVQHLELKQELIAACLRVEALGFTIGTYGNLSVRVPEGLIVTPSRISYSALTPEDMVTVALDGKIVDGKRLPSSETDVHRLIYVARPDIGAVIHTHSLYATALSTIHDTIPVMVEEQSQVVGDVIRCTRYVPAGQHEKLGEEVARTLGKSNAVLLANHGTVSCARNIEETIFTCQIVERIAQMRCLTSAIRPAIPIPPEFVVSERERWLYKYGTTADRH